AQLTPEQADHVTSKINTVFSPFGIPTIDNDLIQYIDASFDEIYLHEVKSITVHNTIKNIKIVYSPLHGTGSQVVPKLLKEVGYEVYPVKEQMIPDPAFSNAESSKPEEDKAYKLSLNLAEEVDADAIFVTDPDADRLGVAVKKDGTYHILNGNQTASLVLYYLLSERPYEEGFVYTTVVTTDLIKKIAYSFNQKVG